MHLVNRSEPEGEKLNGNEALPGGDCEPADFFIHIPLGPGGNSSLPPSPSPLPLSYTLCIAMPSWSRRGGDTPFFSELCIFYTQAGRIILNGSGFFPLGSEDCGCLLSLKYKISTQLVPMATIFCPHPGSRLFSYTTFSIFLEFLRKSGITIIPSLTLKNGSPMEIKFFTFLKHEMGTHSRLTF